MKFSVEGQAKLVRKWAREKYKRFGILLSTAFTIIESWWKVIWPYFKKALMLFLKRPGILYFIIKLLILLEDSNDCEEAAVTA